MDFPGYKVKSSGEKEILCGIFHEASRVPLQFMIYHGNLNYFSYSVGVSIIRPISPPPRPDQQASTKKVVVCVA